MQPLQWSESGWLPKYNKINLQYTYYNLFSQNQHFDFATIKFRNGINKVDKTAWSRRCIPLGTVCIGANRAIIYIYNIIIVNTTL